jgi:hypothetical protein
MSAGQLIRLEAPPMSVESIRERTGHVQALVKSLMVEGVHFMTIPGTDSKSLTKQGTEMLLSAFHISVEPMIEDKSDSDAVRFTVKITGTHMGSGIVVGVGVGRCSSNEEKYKWRRAVCREEWDTTPEARRRLAWKTGQKGAYSINQVRTNPEDVANTVLKMAKKRAQADLCLTALAASDAFRTQPRPPSDQPTKEQVRDAARARPEPSETVSGSGATKGPQGETKGPERATEPPRPATAAQLGLLKKKIDDAGVPENAFLAQFELGRIEEIPFARVDEALAWLRGLAP